MLLNSPTVALGSSVAVVSLPCLISAAIRHSPLLEKSMSVVYTAVAASGSLVVVWAR